MNIYSLIISSIAILMIVLIINYFITVFKIRKQSNIFIFKFITTSILYWPMLYSSIIIIIFSSVELYARKDTKFLSYIAVGLSELFFCIKSSGLIFTEQFAFINNEIVYYSKIKQVTIKDMAVSSNRKCLAIELDLTGSIEISIKNEDIEFVLTKLKNRILGEEVNKP